ncbi:unnamed protein product [Cercospora beticola]|nr:unnamed protein product [Cercospora beticola]
MYEIRNFSSVAPIYSSTWQPRQKYDTGLMGVDWTKFCRARLLALVYGPHASTRLGTSSSTSYPLLQQASQQGLDAVAEQCIQARSSHNRNGLSFATCRARAA